ncbi:hypothetical protein, partial [Amnibacterium endophyticum]
MRSFRFALLLQRRQSTRDLPLLLVLALLTLLVLVCALGGPRLLAGTLDRSVRQVVADAPDPDVVVQGPVGTTTPGSDRLLVDPYGIGSLPGQVRQQLPASVRRVTDPPTAAVTGADVRLTSEDTRPALQNGPVGLQLALLPGPRAVRLRDGALPDSGALPGVVDVVLSQAVAGATSLRVGSAMDVPLDAGNRIRMRVTGIVERLPETSPSRWRDLGPVWSARENRNGTAAPLQATALTDAAGIQYASDALGPFSVLIRLPVVPERLSAVGAHRIAAEVVRLRAQPGELLPQGGQEVTVRSDLPEAVATAEQRARSATAQFLLLAAGVLGTGAVAIVLLGGLIAARRRETVALQRARGASLRAVAAPALLESAAVVVVAGALAALVVGVAVSPGAAAIAAVALLATPAQVGGGARSGAGRGGP